MKKFHVNNDNIVGKCTASKQACEFDDNSHFFSEEAANEAVRVRINGQDFATMRSNKVRPVNPPLSSIMDVDMLQKMLDERFINTSVHPDDPNLVVLTYSHNAQQLGRWNEVTKQARGLIVRKGDDGFRDAVIVERPWRKFFTLQQMTSTEGNSAWALGDEDDGDGDVNDTVEKLDFNAPAEVTDKLDGSMGVLFIAPDGDVAFSTKGSMKSDQAVQYTNLLHNNEKLLEAARKLKKDHPNTTFLFELIGKKNQIVLEYGDDEVVFIGAVDKVTGKYHSTSDYADTWSEDKGLSCAEVMKAKNLQEALSLPDRENREGVVVRIMSDDPEKQMQVKFKQEDYKMMHRMLSAVSKTSMRRLVFNSTATKADLISVGRTGDVTKIPEIGKTIKFYEDGGTPLHRKLATDQRVAFNKVILEPAREMVRIQDFVDNLPASDFEGDQRDIMKRFFEKVKNEEKFTQTQLLECFRGRLTGRDWGEAPASLLMAKMSRKIEFGKDDDDE